MATPKAGLKTMPTGILKNEQVYNEGATMLEALCYRGVVSRSLLDPSTIASPAPTNGTIYLVPDGSPNAVGEWATHGGSMAVYYDGWRYLPPDEGLTLWVTDEAQSIQFRSGEWINRNELAPTLLTDLADVSLAGSPSPQDGESLVYNAALGQWMAGAGAAAAPAVIGTIDLSVNNASITEAAARQITGLAAYKHIIVTIFGMDPAETDTLQMRLMIVGGGSGVTGIINGYQWTAPTTRAGLENFDFINIGSAGVGADNAHATIEGHWSSVTPTVIRTATYDNDAGAGDYVQYTDSVTNATTVYDGLSFLTDANTVIQGVITVYGWD